MTSIVADSNVVPRQWRRRHLPFVGELAPCPLVADRPCGVCLVAFAELSYPYSCSSCFRFWLYFWRLDLEVAAGYGREELCVERFAFSRGVPFDVMIFAMLGYIDGRSRRTDWRVHLGKVSSAERGVW